MKRITYIGGGLVNKLAGMNTNSIIDPIARKNPMPNTRKLIE